MKLTFISTSFDFVPASIDRWPGLTHRWLQPIFALQAWNTCQQLKWLSQFFSLSRQTRPINVDQLLFMKSFQNSWATMGPPKYGDLGKQASDVFGKGYHFGLLKLEVTIANNISRLFLTSTIPFCRWRPRPRLELSSPLVDLPTSTVGKWPAISRQNTRWAWFEGMQCGWKRQRAVVLWIFRHGHICVQIEFDHFYVNVILKLERPVTGIHLEAL